MSVLGIDTSNYTTSVACFDGTDGVNCSQLLPVKQGELGLRQSDAVFANAGKYNLEHCNNVTNPAGRRVWGFLGIEAVAAPAR